MAEKTREQWKKEWEEYLKDREENYTSELVPLTSDEAIAAMKAGERLESGRDPRHIAQYKWDGQNIIVFDSWEHDCGGGIIIPEAELPQLYHRVWKKKEQA